MLPRARRDEITRMVIETTGLADPAPILATLMSDPVAAAAYRLDGIVTVVDAVNGDGQLDRQPEAVRQVAVADRLVMSKTDLADPAPLRARLARLNPGAPVAEAAHGVLDPAFVLHAGLFDPRTKIPDVAGLAERRGVRRRPRSTTTTTTPTATTPVSRVLRHAGRPARLAGPGMWLEMLVASRGENLLRVKGILNLKGQDRPVAIHAVRHLMHPPVKLAAWPEGDPRTSRLVFITSDLPRSRHLSHTTLHGETRASYSLLRQRRSASSQAARGCRSGTQASPVLASDDTASGVTTTSSKRRPVRRVRARSPAEAGPRVSTRSACMPKARAMAAWSLNCSRVPTTLPWVTV